MPYKIRKKDPTTGEYLYSSGSARPTWGRGLDAGKTWGTIGKLKNHLNLFIYYAGSNLIPTDWEVIEVELRVLDGAQSARQMMQEKADRDRMRHLRWQARDAALQQELEQLEAKYGKRKRRK